MESARRLELAQSPETTPFDYIVVGSGAGGGPLAARLAEGGATVLVIEAGNDEIAERAAEQRDASVLEAPLFHGRAVEDPSIAWDYRVRHYADPALQARDTKAVPDMEAPDARPAIQKPRSSALGGCTAHHAMITAYGCDDAWAKLRDLTGDDSWHPERMRRYFQRIERCEYRKPFTAFGRWWRGVVAWFAPRALPFVGGDHGTDGWLTTVVTDPTTALGDHELVGVLAGAFSGAKRAGLAKVDALAKAIATASIDGYLDVNDAGHWRKQAEGVRLIPLGIALRRDESEPEEVAPRVRRTGVRERLRDVSRRLPERLVIATATHVTRLVLRDEAQQAAPRAVGVEWVSGRYLYKASPLHAQARRSGDGTYYARHEVIVCAGSFNTPQLLMLSGIGPRAHLESHGVACRVDLAGVGENLQDRYEVCVVDELARPFATLDGVEFDPDDARDRQLAAWRAGDPRSLYGNNGGALAVLWKSNDELELPDIFMFAAPAMFRGYYPGWSRDLLRRPGRGSAPGEVAEPAEHRNLLTWVILKARTKNRAGTVRLRSSDPFATPIVTHHHFGEQAGPEAVAAGLEDLHALSRAVEFARSLNDGLGAQRTSELWPGRETSNGSPELAEWIRDEAWGHHPCGTCRIGSDAWQPTTADLKDERAVLDSRFRVHGVRGLRVVDASVFPEIPGYFIVTPIYCVSEKAADDILSEFERYPKPLESAEAGAIHTRRAQAAVQDYDGPDAAVVARNAAAKSSQRAERAASSDSAAELSNAELPADTVGLALSGGGIRSATFSLGVLQTLARTKRLREIDLLSTVSGGTFIGSFLGRMFERPLATAQANPAIAVEQALRSTSSAPLGWLRSQADYINAADPNGDRLNFAVYLRNLLSVHVVLAVFGVAILGLLRWASGGSSVSADGAAPWAAALFGSPWWALVAAVAGLAVVPLGVAAWWTPRVQRRETYNPWPLVAGILALALASFALLVPEWRLAAGASAVAIAMAFAWTELVRIGARLSQHEFGATSAALPMGTLLRNRTTRMLGIALHTLTVATAFALIDSTARWIVAVLRQSDGAHMLMGGVASVWSALYAGAALLSPWLKSLPGASKQKQSGFMPSATLLSALVAVPVALLLAVSLDVAVHASFEFDRELAVWTTIAALVLSAVMSRAFSFVNQSSLHATYAARLTRTFLGASNPERLGRRPDAVSHDVQLAHPDDDTAFAAYHPEARGGPLHIVNACLNETVEYASQRDLPNRRGISLACGPLGISIGRRFHGLWTSSADELAVRPVAIDVDSYHPFRPARGKDATRVEALTLGSWIAISGAAFSTGLGRGNSPARSLLTGLANVRLGYWWHTNIGNSAHAREKRPNLWHTLRQLPKRLYRVQSLLFSEWRGRFFGPNAPLWYLSDGGHFENTGLYELVRRRVPFMIASDGSADPALEFESVAELVHLARVDFGAEIEFIEPCAPLASGWERFDAARIAELPAWIRAWIDPNGLCALDELGKPGGRHAALACVRYARGPGRMSPCWLLLLKSSMTGDEPLDLVEYRARHPSFPSESTVDQVYDETQWECYRRLGEHASASVLRARG